MCIINLQPLSSQLNPTSLIRLKLLFLLFSSFCLFQPQLETVFCSSQLFSMIKSHFFLSLFILKEISSNISISLLLWLNSQRRLKSTQFVNNINFFSTFFMIPKREEKVMKKINLNYHLSDNLFYCHQCVYLRWSDRCLKKPNFIYITFCLNCWHIEIIKASLESRIGGGKECR